MKHPGLRPFTAKYSLGERDSLLIHSIQAVVGKRIALFDVRGPKRPDSGVFDRLLDGEEGCNVEGMREVEQTCRTAVVLNCRQPIEPCLEGRRRVHDQMRSALKLRDN